MYLQSEVIEHSMYCVSLLISSYNSLLIVRSLNYRAVGLNIVDVLKICLVAGFFILLASTWATLQVEQTSNVAEKVRQSSQVQLIY